MDGFNCLSRIYKWLAAILQRNRTIEISTSETSFDSSWEKIQEEFNLLGEYDLHNIIQRPNKVGWCEWHLNIDKTVNVIKIADKFHKDFEKLASSTSLVSKIDIIEKKLLIIGPNNEDWNRIRTCFTQARKNLDPSLILTAYTVEQALTRCLNKYLAVNTHHTLKLYCTLLNCPILVRTQDFTEAFTSILFHPELTKYLVKQETVYRGFVPDDEKLVANLKKGATIITTTLLSTSRNRRVAEIFCENPPKDKISVFCTYKINNTRRRTALDLRELSDRPDEEEIVILPYVPFTITSIERTNGGRRLEICLDEYKDQLNV